MSISLDNFCGKSEVVSREIHMYHCIQRYFMNWIFCWKFFFLPPYFDVMKSLFSGPLKCTQRESSGFFKGARG